MVRKVIPARKDVLPPELRRAAPRPVSFNANGAAVVLALISLLVGGIGGGLWIYQEATGDTAQAQRLAAEGQTAEGKVLRIESGEGNRNFLHYRYTAGGKEFDGVARISKRARGRFSIGSSVPIRYLPSNPQASWMRGYEPNGVPLWLAPALFVTLLLSAAPLAWVLRRQRRLLADGRPALARVLKTEKIKGHESETWRVQYEWQLLSGATRRGKFETAKTPPAPGTMIPIVYDREEPQRHGRYPMLLVKIARL